MSLSEVCKEHRCVIIIKVPHFSDTVPYQLATEKQVSCHHDSFLDQHYSVQVYANGTENGEDDESYVSALFAKHKFRPTDFSTYDEFSFVAGVLDASGGKRFPRSYVFLPSYHSNNMTETYYGWFMLSRVVKRDALLSEPDDLLTDDCLTLHIEVIFRSWSYEPIIELEVFVNHSFEYQNDGKNVALNLDSQLGKHLIEESYYFRSMSKTPMIEKERGYAIFSFSEYFVFRQVCYILEGVKNILVPSAKDLRMIYAAADKYDIPDVIESCRGLLSTLLREAENDPVIMERIAYDVPLFLDLADACNDVLLKKIVESFIQRTSRGGIKDSGTIDSTRDRSDTEWRLEKYPVGVPYGYFVFARGTPEEEHFDFYQ